MNSKIIAANKGYFSYKNKIKQKISQMQAKTTNKSVNFNFQLNNLGTK